MTQQYYRSHEMHGEKAFRCWNCHAKLIDELVGEHYEAQFTCPRCKTMIHLKCNESIPYKSNIEQK